MSQTPISHQGADESRPTGLMRGAKPLAGIALKILVEEQQIAPRLAALKAGI